MKNFSYEIGKVEQTIGKYREHRFIVSKEKNILIYHAMARTEGGEPHHDYVAFRCGLNSDKCVGGGVAEFDEKTTGSKNILIFWGVSKSCGGAVPYDIMIGFEELLLKTYKKIDPSIEGIKILTEDSNEFLSKWLERAGKV